MKPVNADPKRQDIWDRAARQGLYDHGGHRISALLVPQATSDDSERVITVVSCQCGAMAALLAGEFLCGDEKFGALVASDLPAFVHGNMVRYA